MSLEIRITPSILNADFSKLDQEIESIDLSKANSWAGYALHCQTGFLL